MSKVVITGAPCTGKSSFIAWMKSRHPDTIYVPEAASIVKGLLAYTDYHIPRSSFQCMVYQLQLDLERWVDSCCSPDALILYDRGTIDCLAYDDTRECIALDFNSEYLRYDAVLQFLCYRNPSSYYSFRDENIYRDESYTEMLEIEEKLTKLWEHHDNYHALPWTECLEDKYNQAFSLIHAVH